MTQLQAAALAVALIGLGACGGKQGSTTPAAGASDDPVVEITRLRDALCACTDQACAARVGDQLNAMNQRFAGATISDADTAQVQAASADIDRCMAKLTGGPEDERISPSNN